MTDGTPGRESRRRGARGAIREGFVIVFSVLIALALDAWWQELGDRARERSYLASLTSELDSLSAAIDSATHRDSVHLANTEAALRVLREDGAPTVRDDSLAAALVLNYSIFDPPTGTLRLLATSEEAAYIRSEEILTSLRGVEGSLVRTEALLNRTEGEVWSLAQRFTSILEQLWDSNGRRPVGGPLLGDAESSRVTIPLMLQRSSPELRSIYQDHVWVLQNRIFYLGVLEQDVDTLRELVG